MNWILENYVSIIVVLIIAIMFYFALKKTIKNKGKCSSCEKKDSCPFKNKNICKK